MNRARARARAGARARPGFARAHVCRAPRAQDWLTLITDGAAQKWYVVPRSAGTDLGRQALQLKLVGTLIHSHVLVLHIVAPHLPDDPHLFWSCFSSKTLLSYTI